ncbi:MAG: hypothetical protein EB060_02140 [Proteobacteria bacterium]|nr:hypothetical protein [Pseudomonadota bacterium]
MVFPAKKYDRLSSLGKRWTLSQEDIYYAVENGMLRVCVYMPLRFVERCAVREHKIVFESHEQKQGFIAVRPEDFFTLCSTGRAKLRIFNSITVEGHILRLALEPPQPDIVVRIHDLVVLREDREKFEAQYEIIPLSDVDCDRGCDCPNADFSYTGDYRHVTINGEEFQLGAVQAMIVQQLHDASASMNPWVYGKTLLFIANSRSMKLREVFKSKNEWSKLIVSDGRGQYRLNVPIRKTSASAQFAKAA